MSVGPIPTLPRESCSRHQKAITPISGSITPRLLWTAINKSADSITTSTHPIIPLIPPSLLGPIGDARCKVVIGDTEMGRTPLLERVGAILGAMLIAAVFMLVGRTMFPELGQFYLLLLWLVLGFGVLGIAIEAWKEMQYQWRRWTR